MHPRRSSATARLIARCTLLAAQDPARRVLVPADAVAPLAAMLAADGGGGWFRLALRHAWTRAALSAMECAVLPGIITHYLARKRWLERAVIATLDAGCTQVVVFGAGFDTLAWRLHRDRPGAHFFELDHPATQAPKRQALGDASNLTFLAADLATASPAAVLRACPAFSPDKPALFLAEGLLMYFPEKRVGALLREIATLSRPPAEVLFTCMDQTPNGAITFRGESATIGWWLRGQREPFQWGIASAVLSGFLQSFGLHLSVVVAHDDLRAQVLAPLGLSRLPLARGECVCRCSTIAP